MQAATQGQTTGHPTVITGPERIKLVCMISQRAALNLERKGLRHSRGSVLAIVKRSYGLTGNREAVYTQFCELIENYKLEHGFVSEKETYK